MHNLESEW